MKGAWVTLATNDSYSLGALVLAHSLRQVGTTQELAVLVTPGVTSSMRTRLSEVFNLVKEVNVLDSRDQSNLRLLRRPELGITFTKLHCWQLTQYEKCVFLDADTLVLQNCDELFDREEFSAAPDVGWPDCFNSGVFVYRPSGETFDKLIQFALEKGSFDGGDQGLLNLYFSDWAHKDISKHLPFIYNVCSTAFYSYLPAFKQFGKDVKILHFIGNAKPWLQYFDTETRTVRPSGGLSHLSHILQKWWDIFCHMVHPNLLPDMSASYPDTVSESTPPQSFQTPYTKPDSPTRHSCEPQNVWDPWEEYDRNQQNLPSVSTQPFESHNTSAFSLSANKPSVPIHSVPSSPTFHEYHDTQIEQSSNLDNSRLFEYYNVDVNNSEAYLELPQNEQSSHECSHHEDLLLNDNHEENSLPTVTTVISNEFSETPPHLESPRENCDISSSSMRYVLSPSDDFSNQALPDPLTIVPVDPPCSSENFPKTLSPKSLEECETPASITNGATERQNETQESGLAGAFSKLILGQQRTPEQEALESNLRRQNWEQGNIDYLGRDSFDNIWTKICETLAKAPQKAEDSPATLDSVADTQQQVEKEPQPSQEIVTAPESSKQDDKTGETKESCVAPPPTEEIQSTPREGAVCSLPISEQRSEVSSEVTNIASSEPSSVSPTESQSEAIAPVIPIDKDPNSILSSTVQSTNVQVAKEKEVATSTQTELAATESTESTKGVPEIAPVSSAPLPENVSQQSQIAGKIDEALPIIPQSPTSGEANQVIPESVKPSEPSESVCVPAKEESAPTDTISSVPQCLDTMQTPIAAEKQNLADVPVTENQSSPNAKDSCSITSQTSAQTQSSQVETPTPCVPIPISETPSNDQSSGQSDISPREEIPPPEGISTSEVIPVSSKLLSESPISSPMQTTPPAQVPAPVETSTQSQPPQEVPSATVASSCKEQCAVPEASQVADPVKISPSPIKSTETSVKLESTSVEETTTKESQTPKTQDAAPSSQVASETTQAASSPAAKVEVCPIAPPPRKSGGTKKQGKSKK